MLAPLAQQNNLTPGVTATSSGGAALSTVTTGTLIDEMPHEASHTRRAYDQDELGGQTSEDVSVATGLACWVQNASMAEINAYQKQDTLITHKVFFASKPDIRPGDKLTITSGPSFVGVELEHSAGPTERSAGLGVLWAAFFEEDDNPRRS